MTTKETSAKPGDIFHCPSCGQRHRANLTRLREDHSAARLPCAGCGKTLVIRWQDGGPAVDLGEGAGEARVEGMKTPLPIRPSGALGRARPARKEAEAEEGAAAEPEPMPAEFASGTRIGRYVLEEAIGSGGTGTVYRAFDPTTNRYVALKILAKELKDERRDRFLREIEVQANLRHPHIMPVFDRGEHEGRPYFTMELLYRPFTLTDVVGLAREGTLFKYATLAPLEDLRQLVRTVLIPVCDGIFVANVENGVIHRDLKPDNVLIDSRTLRAYVIDFGICHVVDRPGRRFSTTVVSPNVENTGIVGTPRFLAPEQARGTVHERTDVWGLGSILRFLVTGEPPIAPASAITRAELRRRIEGLQQAAAAAQTAGDQAKADLCREKLARLEAQDVRPLDAIYEDARAGRYVPLPEGTPEAVVSIVERATAPKPLERHPDARALADDLETWLLGAKKTEAVGGRGPAERRKASIRRVLSIVALFGAGAIGFGLGTVLAPRGREAVAEARVGDLGRDLAWVESRAAALAGASSRSRAGATEGWRLHDLLVARLEWVRQRLADLPSGPAVDATAERARALAERLSPSPLRWSAPGKVEATIFDMDRGGSRQVAPGEVSLPPGEYRLVIGDVVRIPFRVPFTLREEGAARGTIDLAVPIAPEQVPDGYVLVVGGRVAPRGPPGSEFTAYVSRGPYLVDRHEVDNESYSRFLEGIGDDAERARRVPSRSFVPDPREPGHFRPVAGTEGLPVVGVSPADAAAFCAWRSTAEGATVRLPTEAEWVLAAGGSLEAVLLPAAYDGDLAEETTKTAFTPPLRSARATESARADTSPWGPLRMLGNAREIVVAEAPVDGMPYLAKGGAVGDSPVDAAIRRVRPVPADARDDRTGFRAVREL